MGTLNKSDACETLRLRLHGDDSLPTLIYLPGLHGDWTLVASFRRALAGRVRFVEFTYPRTLTWPLDDYATAIEAKGLTNLSTPREIKVVREIPKLGTGKVDHRELQAMIQQ